LLNGQPLNENILIQHLAVNSSDNDPAKAVLSVGKRSWVTRVVLGPPEPIVMLMG